MAWWKLHKRDKPGGPPGAGGAVLASAAIITRDQVRSVIGKTQEWQAQGWDFYRSVPELKSGVRWAANGLSRARLYVGRIDPDGSSAPVPVDAQDDDMSPELAAKLLAPLEELAGGQLGQSEMLRRLSVHLDIPGESYLVGFDDPTSGERRWLVCSPSEVTSTGGGGTIRVQLPDSQSARIELSIDDCTLIRLWRPDDEFGYLPDSPIQGLQDPLRELQGLTAHVLATVDSRLKGAGIGLISDEVTPASPQQSDGPNPIHSDPVTAALIEAFGASLRNRDSAAALVPILLRVPGSVEDKFKWFDFAAQLDEQLLPLRESATKRVAIGLDTPPEALTGMADVNHWTGWLVSDTGITMHLEPKLGLVCDAFTTQYFRPAWEALGVPDPENWACWYDTSDLKQRPNRAPEAAEAHARGAISDAAYLRELGFSAEDMPDEDEQRRRLLVQLATTNAQLAPAALEALGVRLPGIEQAAATDAARAPVEISRVAPAVEAPVRDEPPALPLAASAVLDDGWRMACLDLAARRALARAGNWLLSRSGRSRRGQLSHVPVHEVHMHLSPDQADLNQMLDGAYRDFHAATPGETGLHAAVDLYVRRLLLTGIAHERRLLAGHLAAAGHDRAAA
ncbi:hypothetical protein AB0D98_11035 [Streptomyces sp. NPDC047987]|uniref:hypothetical protein n=1 Tax=unclassified Streptomyces TaxID=2593676 RepID=UPI0034398462